MTRTVLVGLAALGSLLLLALALGVPLARLLPASLAIIGILVARHWRRLYIIARTLPRDLRYLLLVARLSRSVKRCQRMNVTSSVKFKMTARRNPDKTCFLFQDAVWTYREVDALCNRTARVFQAAGLSRGDVVALVMLNRPEYVCTWLGLSQLGVVTALINTNLRDVTLAHCLNVARPKAIIVDPEHAAAVLEVRDSLDSVQQVYQLGGAAEGGLLDLQALLDAASPDEPIVKDPPSFNDPVLYVYTSGTTGMPKAAILPHSKLIPTSLVVEAVLRPSATEDVAYCTLPLYHAAGGVYCVGLALYSAVPVVITKKFSVSRFWSDCIKYNVTAVQYIGELCRYLMLAPASPLDRQHRVRVMFGNGLQPAVWRQLQRRFNIPLILEAYAATEGNANIINNNMNVVGSVGFLPRCLPSSALPIAVIRVDQDTMEPVREPATGHCTRCMEGEVGMLIGEIQDGSPAREFHGYLDREATEKKILRDVFRRGDRFFMTGDAVVMDELGFIYFKDRTGDTFRWKGENVSTTEVEAVISSVTGVQEVAVYGVEVAGLEGRIGMAAVADPLGAVSLEELARRLADKLPSYARPAFLRVAPSLPTTATHKVTKATLKKEAFDLARVNDPIYFLGSGKFVRLTQSLVDDIQSGKIRL